MKYYIKILIILLPCLFSCVQDSVKTIDSECLIDIEQEFLTDSIIANFKLELNNQNIKKNFSTIIDTTLNRLERSKNNKLLLWPYSQVDSVKYFSYKLFDGDMSKHDLKDRKLVKVVLLCQKKINAMLNLINNPNYFCYGQCGTAIPESEMKFYFNGEVIGEIRFACNHGQMSSHPYNMLNKFGGLNEKGHETLDAIQPWK